jgi:leucyl aminopeptidase
MEVRFRDASPERIKTGLLVIPVREKKMNDPEIRTLDRSLRGNLRARIQKAKFLGAEDSALLYTSAGFLPAGQLLLIGMGSDSEIGSETWRKIGARARREAAAIGAEDVAIFFAPDRNGERAVGALVEGAQQSLRRVFSATKRRVFVEVAALKWRFGTRKKSQRCGWQVCWPSIGAVTKRPGSLESITSLRARRRKKLP